MLRTVLVIFATMLLSLAFLAACGNTEEQRGAPGEDETPEATEEGDDQGAARTDPEEDEPEGQTAGEQEGEDGSSQISATLEITLVDYEVQMPETADAGLVVFAATNNADHEHGISIEPADAGGDVESLGMQTMEPGQTEQVEIELEPGEYIVFCPVGDHREEHNMQTELTVE